MAQRNNGNQFVVFVTTFNKVSRKKPCKYKFTDAPQHLFSIPNDCVRNRVVTHQEKIRGKNPRGNRNLTNCLLSGSCQIILSW